MKKKRERGKGEQRGVGVALPDDVMGTILSKVDAATLLKCAAALPEDDILGLPMSLSISMPATLFSREMSSWWCGRLINYFLIKAFFAWFVVGVYVPNLFTNVVYFFFFDPCFRWVNLPRFLSHKPTRFLQSLSGLKSLHIEVPLLPYAHCVTNSNFWFRWDAKFGVRGVVDHVMYVFGYQDIDIDIDVDETNKNGPDEYTLVMFAVQHALLHYSMSWLKDGTTVTTNDFGNGGMLIGTGDIWKRTRIRVKAASLCTSAPTLVHDGSTIDDNVVRVRNLSFFFVALDDTCHGPIADTDFVKACLGKSDEIGETIEKRQLRRVVMHMLDHPECIHLED